MSLNISEINVHVTLLQQQSAEASMWPGFFHCINRNSRISGRERKWRFFAGYLKHSDGVARNCMVNYPCSVRILCRQ